MGHYNQGGGRPWDNRANRGGGGHGFRDRGRPQMHRATCSDCGEPCEVPFKPTGEKPVFCNECFKGGGRTSFQPKREYAEKPRHEEKPRSNEDLKEQFEKLNAKLDRVIKMLAPIISPEAKESKEVKEEKVEKMEAVKKPAKKTAKKPAAKKETKKKK